MNAGAYIRGGLSADQKKRFETSFSSADQNTFYILLGFFIYIHKVNATTVKYCRTPTTYSEEFSVVVPPDSISHNTTPNDQLQ